MGHLPHHRSPWFPHPHPRPVLLPAVLFGACLVANGCVEEPGRPPSTDTRCGALRHDFEYTTNIQVQKRVVRGALMEGCLVWRDTLTDSQRQQAAR